MVHMSILNEPEIIENIKLRYKQDNIFTFIGPTLIVMNPYKSIPHHMHADEPHIYQISQSCLQILQEQHTDQAIVISGESGAGKTENAKYAMKFLTSSTKSNNQGGVPIEDRILACNPVLEAFGNAKTVRNDNSSRFGKYVKIRMFDGKITGAEIKNYLLEKSRVTTIAQQERNYHIFYHFLFGCSEETLKNLKLEMEPIKYRYLNQSSIIKVDSIDDKQLWDMVQASFGTMNFKVEEINSINKLLATILSIGNIEFDDTAYNDNNPCSIKTVEWLEKAAFNLNVERDLMMKSMLYKTREVGKQVIESPQSKVDCSAVQATFSKALYDKLFNWLVLKLNLTISHSNGNSEIKNSIGLLDIFGFENFQVNSFEQLCINFTNEKLQQLYIGYIFKSEEEEFKREGLANSLDLLKYQDNQHIIDLMDKAPLGIYDLIDESCQLGSGSDEQLIQKIAKTHGDNGALRTPKSLQDKFSIIHTAKAVEYTIGGFRGKNKDEISRDIERCVQSSGDATIVMIWESETSKTKESKFLGSKFRKQMRELMEELQRCHVHFVRCIKPNEVKRSGFVDGGYVLQQIRYLGVLESVKVRKEGFPVRYAYDLFYSRYHELDEMNRRFTFEKHARMGSDMKGLVKEIMSRLFPKMDRRYILYGNSRVYLRLELSSDLDGQLVEWQRLKNRKAGVIQRIFKRYRSIKMMKESMKCIRKLSKVSSKLKACFKRKKIKKVTSILLQLLLLLLGI